MKTSRTKNRLRASAIVAGAMIVPARLFAAPEPKEIEPLCSAVAVFERAQNCAPPR